MKKGSIKTLLGIIMLLIFLTSLIVGIARDTIKINVIFSNANKDTMTIVYIIFYIALALAGIGFMVWGIISARRESAKERPSAKITTYKIVFLGLMAAVVFVITELRFPMGDSWVHFANGMCILSGLMFGPLFGGISAGAGSALYDAVSGRYDILDIIVTFITKFLMAFAAGAIYSSKKPKNDMVRSITASVIGALLYVGLYMLKTLVFGLTIDGLVLDAVTIKMIQKLPASLINAVAAMISAPILNEALQPAMKKIGVLKKIK